MNYNINLMVGLSWFIEYNMAQPSKQKGDKKKLYTTSKNSSSPLFCGESSSNEKE
jgi:DNA-binding transcriptional regulator GbsR (MarR family)